MAATNDPDIRIDAPMFLARYREREAARALDEDRENDGGADADGGGDRDQSLPLYLRQHRRRRAEPLRSSTPLWQRASLPMQRALTEDGRNKEISAPPEARRGLANDVFLIRHAETQGYSTDSGLTPQGAWQAHTYGHTLAKRIASGETVVLRHADTNRARETAQHIERGLRDGLEQFEKTITIHQPEPMDEFRNFQFVSSDGLKDVTAAFREYYAVREQYERLSTGDRPLWLVEMDRFWKLQVAGGDPIEKWLTTPMLHFEPPSMTVRRFWVGINRLAADFPGARLIIPTHSGCIRAFAVAALGYDPGEPYNVEHVRVKIMEGRTDALVSYRNRVQELCVPSIDTLPVWNTVETWQPPRQTPANASMSSTSSTSPTSSTSSSTGAPS